VATPFDVAAAERRIADAERPAVERARATRIEAGRWAWVRERYHAEDIPRWMTPGRTGPDRFDLPTRTLASMLREVRALDVPRGRAGK
jgi:hypothetical protein